MYCVTFQHLSIQTDHGGGLGIEHARQTHQQHFEHAGLQQRHLVVLRQQRESGNPFGELHYAANGRREAFAEVLEQLLLSSQWLRVRIQWTRLEKNKLIIIFCLLLG